MIAANDTGKQSDLRSLRLFQLMQKHTLLALLSVLTSLICWWLFDSLALQLTQGIAQDMLIILSFDRVIKSICIILMYKFYEEIFAKLCCCCLKCTHSACVNKKIKELFPYFDPDPTLEKQTIYAQCHAIQTMEDLYGEDISVKEEDIKILDTLDIPSDENVDTPTMDKKMSMTPTPQRPLPSFPGNKLLSVSKNSVVSNSHSHHREASKSKSKSYSKALPQMDFGVSPYTMLNFICKLTDPQNHKSRFLDYSNKGYTIIPTHVFNVIDEQFDSNILQGIVIMDGYQFDQNKFSFLRKSKTKYPYSLAIRLKDHHQHIDDAHTLLKYAEYKLNEIFKSIKANTSFDYEPYFDKIARDLSSGKNIKGGGSAAFMTFDGSMEDFALQRPSVQVSHSRQASRDISHSNNNHQLQMHHMNNNNMRQSMASVNSAYSGYSSNKFNGPPIHNRQLTPSFHYQPNRNLQSITPAASIDYQDSQ